MLKQKTFHSFLFLVIQILCLSLEVFRVQSVLALMFLNDYGVVLLFLHHLLPLSEICSAGTENNAALISVRCHPQRRDLFHNSVTHSGPAAEHQQSFILTH